MVKAISSHFSPDILGNLKGSRVTMANPPNRLAEVFEDRLIEFGHKIRDRLSAPNVQAQLDDDLYLTARALLESGVSDRDASRLLSKYWEIGVREADDFVRLAGKAKESEARHEDWVAGRAKRAKTKSQPNQKKK